MKNLRVYYFDFIDSKIKLDSNYKLPENIIEQVKIFSNEIVKEYQTKQKGRKGIKSLGNELRYSEIINNKVFIAKNNFSLVKITGNRKDFLKDFLASLSINSTVFFLFFDKSFVNQSSIVDKTSTSIENIEYDLNLLTKCATLNKTFKFYFVELIYLKNYIFTSDQEGFKRIKKINYDN